MALVFCDSFQHYDTAHISEKWDNVVLGSISSPGRYAGSLYLALTSSYFAPFYGLAAKNFAYRSQLIVGAAFLFPSLAAGSGNGYVVSFLDTGTVQCNLIVSANGSVELVLGSAGVAILTLPAATVVAGTYCYIECNVTFSDTTSGSASIAINGTTKGSVTNVQTAITTTSQSNGIQLGPGMASAQINDLYICDGTGTINNAFLGNITVALSKPDGNGRLNRFARVGGTGSGNFTAVDEVPPDNDTSYTYSAQPGAVDLYAISSIGTPSKVVAAQIVASMRKDDAGTRVIAMPFGNGTTESYDSGVSVSDSYSMFTRPLDINPITNSAWLPANFTGAQIGLQIVS